MPVYAVNPINHFKGIIEMAKTKRPARAGLSINKHNLLSNNQDFEPGWDLVLILLKE